MDERENEVEAAGPRRVGADEDATASARESGDVPRAEGDPAENELPPETARNPFAKTSSGSTD